MAFDEKLAARVRKLLNRGYSVEEKRMFGGLTFMVNGHMCCGVLKKDLVLRLAPQDYERALSHLNVRPMDFTGRSLRGLVYVDPVAVRATRDLKKWIQRSMRFVSTLPPK